MKRKTLGWAAMAVVLALNTSPLAAQDAMREESVAFPAGASGTTLVDTITGRESVVYKLGAEAGQTMDITLSSTNTATYFNVYAPGNGPGDEALAVSEMTGPMVPEMNRFSAPLAVSGEYTISVYLFRNAARDGETSDYTLDVSITGATGDVVQGDFADGLQGGPDYWAVKTSGGTMNLRASASAGAGIVARLANGTPLRNLGCRMAEGRTWCNVATLADPGFEGWAAADFLVEGSGEGVATQLPDMMPVPEGSTDALVPGTAFNATGTIDCVRDMDAANESCAYGVTREGDGNGVLTVTWPDGSSRIIFFQAGKPTGYDQSQADGGVEMTVTREADSNIVFIGQQRFVIPDAVIWGG